MFLQIEEINKSYGYGDSLAKVLNGISLDIERGDVFCSVHQALASQHF